MRQVGLLTFCASLIGYASVPNVERFLKRKAASVVWPRIFGERGPLSIRRSRAVLRQAGLSDQDASAIQRHLVIEQEVAETPLVAGNRARFVRDGEDTFRAMFAAVGAAKHHVNLEYYILEDVESDGERLSDLLIAKAREGVRVNVIYDSFGSVGTPDEFFTKLKDAGIAVLAFNPVNPLKAKDGYGPNDRDHRKILVADGRIGIIGGINLSKTYMSSGPGRAARSGGGGGEAVEKGDDKQKVYWRDVDLVIEGPVVSQLQDAFVAQWQSHKGDPLDTTGFYPAIAPIAGGEVMRVIGSTPSHHVPRYYVTLLSAIRNADKNIYVMAAYFVPTRAEKRALIRAAKRGVDVRLLLPGRSDSKMVIAAQRSHYGAFFRAGVKIHEAKDYILHTKMVSIDGVWTIIGSSNLDHRSIIYNDEIDAVVLGKTTASEMERMFGEDSAQAAPVDPQAWRRRPWTERLTEAFARFWEHLL